MKLTQEQLNEIKARPEKATAGPLCGATEQGKDAVLWSIFASDIPFGDAERIASFRHHADAVLFMHASTDIPALRAHIDAIEWEAKGSADLAEARQNTIAILEKKLSEYRNGSWADKFGACKACDGEIPHGHLQNCDILKIENENAELRRDKARLDWIGKLGHTIGFNTHILKFTVQRKDQVVGNIGESFTLRGAVDAAMEETK